MSPPRRDSIATAQMAQATSDLITQEAIRDHVPEELIAEPYRNRFIDLAQHHAQELVDESVGSTDKQSIEGDPEMIQRRAIRGAAHRALRQLWSERKEGTI